MPIGTTCASACNVLNCVPEETFGLSQVDSDAPPTDSTQVFIAIESDVAAPIVKPPPSADGTASDNRQSVPKSNQVELTTSASCIDVSSAT